MSPEEMARAQAEHMRQQQEQMFRQAHAGAGVLLVKDIPPQPQQQYAIIVAIEQYFGGFSKDGAIPWNYPEDFKFFAEKTRDGICVMGRKTYEDINARLGEKAKDSVLPGRKCFVVSKTLTELPNAIVIPNIRKVEYYTDDINKPVFIIGGERLFREGLALANELYITLINKTIECDKFFPNKLVSKHFYVVEAVASTNPDLTFVTYKRK
jgi:dihydrofolate reductase